VNARRLTPVRYPLPPVRFPFASPRGRSLAHDPDPIRVCGGKARRTGTGDACSPQPRQGRDNVSLVSASFQSFCKPVNQYRDVVRFGQHLETDFLSNTAGSPPQNPRILAASHFFWVPCSVVTPPRRLERRDTPRTVRLGLCIGTSVHESLAPFACALGKQKRNPPAPRGGIPKMELAFQNGPRPSTSLASPQELAKGLSCKAWRGGRGSLPAYRRSPTIHNRRTPA
jgi:hypothetical protein